MTVTFTLHLNLSKCMNTLHIFFVKEMHNHLLQSTMPVVHVEEMLVFVINRLIYVGIS